MNDRIAEICITYDATIISALKQMDAVKHKLLIVIKDGKFYRLISIGDIQRAIIKGIEMESAVHTILRDNTKVASVNDDLNAVKTSMRERSNEFMPVIDDDNNLVPFDEAEEGTSTETSSVPSGVVSLGTEEEKMLAQAQKSDAKANLEVMIVEEEKKLEEQKKQFEEYITHQKERLAKMKEWLSEL